MNHAAGRAVLVLFSLLVLASSGALAQRQSSITVERPVTVVPDHDVQLDYYVDAAEVEQPASTEFYRIPSETYVVISQPDIKAANAVEDVRARGTLVRSFVSLTRDPNWREDRVVDVGAYPVGQYAAVTTLAGKTTLTPVSVSSIGIYSGTIADQFILWTVNLDRFTAYHGGVDYVIGQDFQHLQHSNGDGLLVGTLSDGHAWQHNATAFASNGSLSSSQLQGYGTRKHAVTFIQPDRPLYRPGQLVHMRVVVRDGYVGSYRPASGTRHVRILDEQRSVIYARTLAFDRYGALHLDVPLSEDAMLGHYAIALDPEDEWGVSAFDVQAYKKPEYETNIVPQQTAVIGGADAIFSVSTKYFFGRPAAGMHVEYTAYSESRYRYFSPFDRFVPSNNDYADVHGSGTTSDDGTLVVTVPTKQTSDAQDLSLNVDVRDASGRTVSANSRILVVPAKFAITLTPARWFGAAGEPVRLDVSANTYGDGHPVVTPVMVSIAPVEWSAQRHEYENKRAVFEQTVQTSPNGKASVQWTPSDAGFYFITARAVDDAGHISQTVSTYWTSGPDAQFANLQQPLVAFSQPKYGPGEQAKAVITLPERDRDVLAITTTDRISDARVVHVSGYTTTIAVPRPRDAMGVRLTVLLPQESGVERAGDTAVFEPAPRALNVSVTPQREKYEPGQRASWKLHVTDANGRPVKTQISLSVVDAALLALEPDDSNIINRYYDRAEAFYGEVNWYQPHALRTIANVRSAGSLVKSGTTSDVYSVNAATQQLAATPPPSIAPIRSRFADTAYWIGDAQTDSNGNATMDFSWPDNLTTWIAKAVAVDTAASIGQGKGEALVTKDFLVRLELPRFLRKGDKTSVIGIAQSVPGAKNVSLKLDVASDPLDAIVAFDRTMSASTSWPYAAQTIGDQTFTLLGNDGQRSDAMRLNIPIESAGTPEHLRDAGITADVSRIVTQLPQGYDSGNMHITLTPSIVAQLVQDVRLLDVYPYYCTEQTMSAALPAVFVDRVIARAGLQADDDQDTPKIIKHALARLEQLQHDDGSWGWWESDNGHPFMTAYAMYGLSQFRKAGYAVSDTMYTRGIDALLRLLASTHDDTLRFWGGAQKGSEWNTRAYMLFALADAAPQRVPRDLLAATAAHSSDLNSYALSVLGLAQHELGDDPAAKRSLALLNARAVDNGTYRYWTGESWHYAWEDDPIETTAYALRLNAALNADPAQIARIVAFLRSEQRGSWWFTTKDTAAAIYAIAQTVPQQSDEFSPNESVTVAIDGRVVRSVRVTTPILAKSDADIIVPASDIHSGSTIAIERTGAGKLYWSSDFTRYAPPWVHATSDRSRSIFARLFPPEPPLSVTRTLSVHHGGAWRVGDQVDVTITVRAKDDVQYVAIEDPFPAAVEYQPIQGETGYDWSGVQFFDDRAVFFADTVYARWPVVLRYSLRVTTPGTYTAPAPSAYAMYGPPVAAQGDAAKVSVSP